LLFGLIQRFPGYTRETLEAEDAEIVEDWMQIMSIESNVRAADDAKARRK